MIERRGFLGTLFGIIITPRKTGASFARWAPPSVRINVRKMKARLCFTEEMIQDYDPGVFIAAVRSEFAHEPQTCRGEKNGTTADGQAYDDDDSDCDD